MANKVYVANEATSQQIKALTEQVKALLGTIGDPAGEDTMVALLWKINSLLEQQNNSAGGILSIIDTALNVSTKDYIELANVTGKGRLYSFSLNANMQLSSTGDDASKYIEYRVTIDDEVVYNIKNPYQVSYIHIGNFALLNQDFLLNLSIGSSTKTYLYPFNYQAHVYDGNKSTNNIIIDKTGGEVFEHDGSGICFLSPIVGFIPFEKNFKLEIKLYSDKTFNSNSTKAKAFCLYQFD